MSVCRDCGEEIVWLKTRNGKNMPVEPTSVEDSGATQFDRNAGHVSHFDVCSAVSHDDRDAPKNPIIPPDDSGKVPF